MRLVQLLNQSDDPQSDRQIAQRILERADLFKGTTFPDSSHYQFANDLILENSLLWDALPALGRVWGMADLSESVEELIEGRIPS